MNAFLESMFPFVTEQGIVQDILGKQYNYCVVRQAFKAELPGFVGLYEGILFISDSTPAEYREYIFWHEVKCVEYRGRKACIRTVQEELERVPKHMRQAYTEYRSNCFEALMAFYSAKPPDFYQEIVASYQYLMSLLGE